MSEETHYFDMNAELRDDLKLKMPELYAELNTLGETKENVIYAFYHSDKSNSGIFNKLENRLHLDIQLKDTDSRQERFDKLRLYKLIYVTERLGKPKKFQLLPDDPVKIPLLIFMEELFNAPIEGEFSDHTRYAEEFCKIIESVRPQVDDVELREKAFGKFYIAWLKLICSINFDALQDMYRSDHLEFILNRLTHLPANLQNMYNDQLQQPHEGALKTFYNMLLSTSIMAEFADAQLISYDYSDEITPPETVTQNYVMNPFFDERIEFNEFRNLIMRKPSIMQQPESQQIWSVILLKGNPTVADINGIEKKAYDFAVDKAERIANFLYPGKTNIPVGDWIIIFQELLCIFNKNVEYLRSYRADANKPRTLSAAIKHIETESALPRMILMNRFVNRKILTFGDKKHLELKIEVQKAIMKIANTVFAHPNLDELVKAHKGLYFYTAVSLVDLLDLTLLFIELQYRINSKLNLRDIPFIHLSLFNNPLAQMFAATLRIDQVMHIAENQEAIAYQQIMQKRITDIMQEHNISDPGSEELYTYLILDNVIRETLSKYRHSYKASNSKFAITKLVPQIVAEIERLYSESDHITADYPILSKKIFFSVVFNDNTCYNCNMQFRWSYHNNTITIANFGFK